MNHPGRPIEILCVEDNLSDITLLRHFFRKINPSIELHWVGDGASALDFLIRPTSNGKRRPDLILIDLNLPKMNGLELLRELKHSSEWKHIPVIILSTSSRDSDVSESQGLGSAAFYEKPIELKGFEKLIEKIDLFLKSS